MEVVKLLAEEAGQNISATNGPLKSPPLHIASRFNHVDIVSYLIGKGAPVNQLDLDGATALSDAAAAGSLVRLGFQKARKKRIIHLYMYRNTRRPSNYWWKQEQLRSTCQISNIGQLRSIGPAKMDTLK